MKAIKATQQNQNFFNKSGISSIKIEYKTILKTLKKKKSLSLSFPFKVHQSAN